ncbi:MAG TPA: hypothetical protein PKC39_02300 [Ferruginibacter sp.]|nr:hypothetical protein [Ferruginibacter sp.]HMP19767.1 hypothetical protein [Ferruginibacter sp.]
MKAVIQHQHSSYNTYHTDASTTFLTALWQRFVAWADTQEERRFFWAAISLAGHGTFFTIATMATVILTGNVFGLLAAALFPMVLVVIVNLAALPIRYVIPAFILSLIADLVIIAIAIALWLN